jgi:hypothetical protein
MGMLVEVLETFEIWFLKRRKFAAGKQNHQQNFEKNNNYFFGT